MKNFIFISPNFPDIYWRFCAELRANGMRVLGIGDCPYDELQLSLRQSLDEYYKVSTLENDDEVFRAVAYFSFRYGKIDFLESNNEYWLERDAWLRTQFHITTGFMQDDMQKVKYKSAMKAYYSRAGIPTARWHIIDDLQPALAFADEVGYPVVVKPDNGVGACGTFRISSAQELSDFIGSKDDTVYIMEQQVHGVVCTYDAIIGAKGQPLFEAGNVTPLSLMDVVNDSGESIYYMVKQLPDDVCQAGRRTVEAFDVRSRFVHLEFFRLTQDQPGLGKEGELVGLEVNMRPSGGYSTDMYNFAYETDVYKIWADMICFDRTTKPIGTRRYCAFVGRRDGKNYRLGHDAVMDLYGHCIKMHGRIPDVLSGAMGNIMYMVTLDTLEQVETYFRRLLEKQ